MEEKGVGPEVVMGMMRCEEPHPLLTAAGPGVEDCSSSLLAYPLSLSLLSL